jgi:uncharacterized protein (DUF1778 family)
MPTTPQVKIFLDDEEHAEIRLAAAIRRVSMTRFARQVVLDEAHRVTGKAEIRETKPRHRENGRRRAT